MKNRPKQKRNHNSLLARLELATFRLTAERANRLRHKSNLVTACLFFWFKEVGTRQIHTEIASLFTYEIYWSMTNAGNEFELLQS